MRRLIALTLLLALAPAPALASAAAPKPTVPSWAQAELRLVVARGLLSKSAAAHPDDALTQGELTELVAGLSFVPQATPFDAESTVTLAQLDARIVGALGLSPSAAQFVRAARGAGLKPPSRFGTEVVARLLGLRTNHPAAQESLELRYDEPATRAEAAYSVARVLRFRGFEVDAVKTAASMFSLPFLDPWQRRVLTTAVGRIGLPYIWGGTTDLPQAPMGIQVSGGFDCSGFAWRVFKQPYPGGAGLAGTLKGRTAAAMAAEIAPPKRIAFTKLRPADLVFFGAAGPRSKPGQVDHMGIALGNGWIIHSSRYGVALAELTGWYRDRFAWGRRPLAEAGLAGSSSPGLIPPDIR